MNIVLDIVVISIYGYILNKLIYYIFIEDFMINSLNIQTVSKKNF